MQENHVRFKKIKWLGLVLILMVIVTAVYGQHFARKNNNDNAETTLETIKVDELFSIDYISQVVSKLGSVEYDGRYPGTEGNEKASEFIATEMERIGLVSPQFATAYRQEFTMVAPIKKAATRFSILEGASMDTLDFGEDFAEFVTRDYLRGIGRYRGLYKVIDDPFERYAFDGYEAVLYTSEAMQGLSFDALFNQIILLEDRPKVVMYESSQQNSGHFILSPYSKAVKSNDNTQGLMVYKVSEAITDRLVESEKLEISVSTHVEIQKFDVPNIIGMIDGTGEEGYLITAHFDHLGNNFDGSYNPGTLDNASGTAVMLALAKALKVYANPDLDYYFVAFNGEEQGLYGSEALALSGQIDAEKIQMINIDMVGASVDIPMMISATSKQSKAYQNIAIEQASLFGIDVEASDSGSSDHVPFEYAGYKAISLTELDKRFYHTPKDVTVDYDKMKTVAAYIYQLIMLP